MDGEMWLGSGLEVANSSAAIKSPTSHESLYKYVGLNTKTSWKYLDALLNDSKLYGATLLSLNDPFEGSPYLIDDLNQDVIREIYNDSREALTKRLSGENCKTREDLEFYRELSKSHLQQMLSNYRVISFCSRFDSPLLWSHYANSYKGACLHFLGRSFSRRLGNFRSRVGYVTYTNQRPGFPMSLAIRNSLVDEIGRTYRTLSQKAEIEKFCFFTKGLDWSYESEVRIIYDVSKQTYYGCDISGLVGITLGPRMTDEDRDRVAKLVSKSKRPNLQIMSANLSSDAFSVVRTLKSSD